MYIVCSMYIFMCIFAFIFQRLRGSEWLRVTFLCDLYKCSDVTTKTLEFWVKSHLFSHLKSSETAECCIFTTFTADSSTEQRHFFNEPHFLDHFNFFFALVDQCLSLKWVERVLTTCGCEVINWHEQKITWIIAPTSGSSFFSAAGFLLESSPVMRRGPAGSAADMDLCFSLMSGPGVCRPHTHSGPRPGLRLGPWRHW